MSFKKFRTSFTFRVLSVYLALSLLFPPGSMYRAYALTGGPSQPEFNSFTPISTSDMVNLSSGDFNYNIPIMDIGGYPINLAYDSGITMDQEASWVGLGWNLNVGQIARSVKGLPDDFKGDKLKYEDELKDNISVGARIVGHPSFFGLDSPISNLGITAEYNNYEGITLTPSFGLGFSLSKKVSVGFDISASTTQGANVSPNLSISSTKTDKDGNELTLKKSVGTSFNSRQGVSSLSLSSSVKRKKTRVEVGPDNKERIVDNGGHGETGSASYGISFAANTYTPTKRTAFLTQDYALSGALGGEFWGIEFDGEIYAFGSKQSLIENKSYEKAFGYEHTEVATYNDILDFNRENDRSIGKHTKSLSLTNYTYDSYSINGQGVSGMFRPYKSQVGYVYDRNITDKSEDLDFGAEFGGGAGVHNGVDVQFALSTSSTGIWKDNNPALSNYKSSTQNSGIYERTYFKTYGELIVDPETDLLYSENSQIAPLGGDQPIRIGITTGNQYKYDRKTNAGKYLAGTGVTGLQETTSFSTIKRNQRILRNQSIQKITKYEAELYKPSIKINEAAKNHHTAAFSILKPDGSTYVFGQTAYNLHKEEATFDVSGGSPNYATELVTYFGDPVTPSSHSDKYLNRVTTPPYAHTYMLTEVLSADYEDIDGNGPDYRDLGSYTKISYKKGNNNNVYKWRIPYERNMATFNEGLKSIDTDDKGSYVYGEKEILYVDKIETKTHIAIFYTSPRKDALGVKDNRGGASNTSFLEKIDKIVLYAKKDYDLNNENATPIKTVYFEYDYSQCKNVPNNNLSQELSDNELSNEGGKLTLKKVYFTYQNSNMGKYTPYEFNYGQVQFDSNQDGVINENDISNPDYDIKGYDMWGNYKPNSGLDNSSNSSSPSNAEFPYVQQTDKQLQDLYATAWNLTSIDLPSGGSMSISYETDDYAYVQDKKAMQMYQVVGAGTSPQIPNNPNASLYGSGQAKYLYIKVNEPSLNQSDFIGKYLGDLIKPNGKSVPIYFRFLLNMRNNKSDFVTGYFIMNNINSIHTSSQQDGTTLVSIPMKQVDMEGGVAGGFNVNPISKAGWYFARKYLNRMMFSATAENTSFRFIDVVGEILNSFQNLLSIFSGPNLRLKGYGVARTFNPNKSWIRLYHAKSKKLGGGVRVNKIQMSDNWDAMINSANPLYKQFYGQEYSYETEDGRSSGVATFEPEVSKENPFVKPYYDTDIDRFLAPSEENYAEEPFGASFFPAPTITYERVVVKNMERKEGDRAVKKHATGYVENIFYTSKDFPTICEHTPISSPSNYDMSALGQLLNLRVRQHFTVSQGFVVRTNDMNGKSKSQKVYNEAGAEISGVDYIYQHKNNELDNIFPVIDSNGGISEKTIGVSYDVVNDFRESRNHTSTIGMDINLAVLLFFIPVPFPFAKPNVSDFENILRTATTTKVIHKTGVLKKKIAYDLGATVSTENLAWDAETGQIVVTKTVNEYDDAYYNINYLAHTRDAYKGMKAATHNLGMTGYLEETTGTMFAGNETEYLTPGDEIYTYIVGSEGEITTNETLWVINKDSSNKVLLMNRYGKIVNDCPEQQRISKLFFKVMRSGYRNLQTASMQNITSMINPVYQGTNLRTQVPSFEYSTNYQTTYNPTVERVINASAVEYSDFWPTQNELQLPYFTVDSSIYDTEENEINENNLLAKLDRYNINPYRYNIRGDWRAIKSWAYLGGRYQSTNASPRNDGFYTTFSPFYTFNNNATPNRTDWTFASEISLYSPYGVELENKDALGRHSSAQYDFLYTLPTAVASNTAYRQLGYDGFEDDAFRSSESYTGNNSHFRFNRTSVAFLTNKEAHTGNKSVAIQPNSKLSLLKTLEDCEPMEVIDDCPPEPICDIPGCEYPDCDCIDLNFTVSDILKNCDECSFSLSFTINGYPGQVTQYMVDSTINTVTLDNNGVKIINISRSASSGGDCYPDDATYMRNITISDLNGNELISHSCEFYCGSGCQ